MLKDIQPSSSPLPKIFTPNVHDSTVKRLGLSQIDARRATKKIKDVYRFDMIAETTYEYCYNHPRNRLGARRMAKKA